MELISESLKDIEYKLEIYYSEKERLTKERNKELSVDPYKLSAIDYSKSVVDSYKKYDMKVRDDDYIKELEEKINKINEEISILENTKKTYLDNLSKMDGIECRLYSYILQGFNPTKAISKVAEENYLKDIKPATERGIAKYYNNMKKICKLQ